MTCYTAHPGAVATVDLRLVWAYRGAVKRCLQILLLSSLAALLGLELRQPSWQQQPRAQRSTSDRPQNYLPLGPEVEFLIERRAALVERP